MIIMIMIMIMIIMIIIMITMIMMIMMMMMMMMIIIVGSVSAVYTCCTHLSNEEGGDEDGVLALVPHPDAVVNHRAVVVKALHTPPAHLQPPIYSVHQYIVCTNNPLVDKTPVTAEQYILFIL